MVKNLCGKSRDVNNPYATFVNGDFEWRVLKTYKLPKSEASDPYARWFVAARSPMTFNSWEYGDTYASDVKSYGFLTFSDDAWKEQYHV